MFKANIINSQKVNNPVSISRWMDKQNVVYLYKEIFFDYEKVIDTLNKPLKVCKMKEVSHKDLI